MKKVNNSKAGGSKLPKGAYLLPTGGYVAESRHQDGKKVIVIRAVHRDPPDIEKLAQAFLRAAEELAAKEKKSNLL
jgi:hypothetical protein